MSPRFKFKFDSVLKHRKALEERESKEFHKKHKEHEREQEKLNNLKSDYKGSQNELKKKKESGISIDELKTYYTYMDSLKLDINAQDIRTKEAEVKKEKQREKLIAAQKKKKVIDKLKERKFEEFKEKERKVELKTIDEINSTKTARDRIKD